MRFIVMTRLKKLMGLIESRDSSKFSMVVPLIKTSSINPLKFTKTPNLTYRLQHKPLNRRFCR